jgi:hypothetical protein
MPTKTKKQAKSKPTVANRTTAGKKTAVKKVAVKKATSEKKMAKKAGRKRPAAKTKSVAHKAIGAKTNRTPKKKTREKNRSADTAVFSLKRPRAGSAGQSGDLQGLSGVQRADSESVAELLEEGNPFEADVVSGVEAADSDEREVRTHEVPEDDVPDEYFDKD